MVTFPSQATSDPREHHLQRIGEILPGALCWGVLLLGIILSFFAPIAAAIFIIFYDLFWLTRVLILSVLTILAYRKLRRNQKINWLRRCRKLGEKHGLRFESVYHLIIIPYVNEGIEIIEPTMKSFLDSNYPNKKIIVSMSCERRAGEEARQVQEQLKKKYASRFAAFLTAVHPNNLPGEMKAKSGNANWALKNALKFLKEKNISPIQVIVSNFDCDTRPHPQYFACVSHHYIVNPDRTRSSYQPLPMFNNNIWDTNFVVRIVSLGTSFWHMIESVRHERLVTFSSHSMSLTALLDVGKWQSDIISEDSAIFWQCYCRYDGNYRTIPLFLPVSMDATLADTTWKTLVNQYKQLRRWAYGIESFPRLLRVFRNPQSKIPLWSKMSITFTMLEGRISWGTTSFLLLLMGWLPLMVGGSQFNEMVLAHNLPLITQFLMRLASVGIICSAILSYFIIPRRPKRYKWWKNLAFGAQSLFIPIVALLMSAPPAMDALTRLMFGKYFGSFWVSEKKTRRKLG
ncbi:MAG: glycosyltransferase family 2 protein [Candidatus Moranbacteria bacterium]|nr:glycosyltransferase family 2 protein [Candidatus Moranbacteria bacterium]